MVIASDLKYDFFDKIIGKQILIIVANGVDSVCTFNIMKRILRNHEVPFCYSIIKTKSELRNNFLKYGKIDNVLLINCGSLFDIIDFLEIEETDSRVIYILDSQRPIHVNNFYNSAQVKILTLQEQFNYVPEFDDIFTNEDENDSDSDDDNDDSSLSKKLRYDPKVLEERIRRKEWKEQREEILDDYMKYSFHGTSSGLVAYHLSSLIHQDSMDLLWSAIVGHTSQYLMNFINRDFYCSLLDLIQSYLAKLTADRKESRKNNLSEIQIEFTNELALWLYRHWTLKQALYYTPVTLTNFQLYRISDKKLREFLVYIGISQNDFEGKFSSMKYDLRTEIGSIFRNHCEKYHLSENELFLPSFVGNCGYQIELSAIDVTFVLAAILDHTKINDTEEFSEKFLRAVKFLSIDDIHQIDSGVQLAMEYVETMNKFTRAILETGDVVVGSFLQVTVKKTSPLLLTTPMMQYFLSRYILEATCSRRPKLGKQKNTKLLPLVICSEGRSTDEDYLILFGIPPLKSDKGKNSFGQIFETALITTNTRIIQDSFDICKIKINSVDKLKIFHKISTLLS